MTRSAQTAVLAAALSALALGAAIPAAAQGSAKPATSQPATSQPATSQPAASPAAPAAAQSGAAQTGAAGDAIVATVNGTPIRASEILIADEDIGPGLSQVQGPQRAEYVLSFLTDMTLLAQAAQAQKIDQTPDFQQRLAYARTKALMEALMMSEAKKAVTEDAKRKTYEEFVGSNKPETEVHARHILVDDEAKAKEIAAKAKAGADFATLAKENSKDSAEDGGDLGYFTKEQMVPAFADAAFKLDKGQVSDPVKSQFGWHVIKVEDKREKPVPTYEQVSDQIEQYLVRKAQTDLVQKLRAEAKIEKAAAPAGAAPAATPAAPAAPATPAPAAPKN